MKPLVVVLTYLLFFIAQCQGQSTQDTTVTVDPEMIYDIVDVAPLPVGGMPAFYKTITQNIQYPASARQKNITGKVFVQFVVERDGTIRKENMTIARSVDKQLDDEAMRVVLLTSPWQPALIKGQPVRSRKTFPISFNLGGTVR